MSRTSKERSPWRGLTLIELLISVLLISAMLEAIWVVYSTGSNVFSGQLSRYDIKNETSLALTIMTKELHQAIAISTTQLPTATSLTFTADLDNNGTTETIQYAWSGISGAPLNKLIGNPPVATKALVRSVKSLTFSYYNTDNTLVAAPVSALNVPNVHLLAVDVTSAKGEETFRLRTKIFLQTL